MFDPFDHEDIALDRAIASAYSHLATLDTDSDEYQKTLTQLSKLYALKRETAQLNLQAQQATAADALSNFQHELECEQHKLACEQQTWEREQCDLPFWKRIDPNTALSVAGSILTAVIVVKYEQTGVISSKVMSFMRKI
jgi:hypothetical protein